VTESAREEKTEDTVLAAISGLQAAVAELAAQAAREHDRAQAREQVIDRLHAEVQRSRSGEARELLRPAVTDLRRLRDDLCAQARSVPVSMDRAELAVLLESYAESVVLILERCGVVATRPEPLSGFDQRSQQVSGVAETTDPGLDGAIASVVSDGYAEADTARQVAPARVIVYRYADTDSAAPGAQVR
jgi:molecular chaperone GrpE (heat shock protein)